MTEATGIRSLPRLRGAGLQEEIYQALRQAILRGALPPGERLRELSLARQFGTSQTPVREALRRLGQEGLVTTFPHRGTFVTRLSPAEVEEVYSLRAELESWAARRFVERAAPADLEALRGHLAAMRAAAARGDPAGVVEADLWFHRALCEGSGSALLVQLWTLIDGRVRGMMPVANLLYAGGLQQVAEIHGPILEALQAGDAAAAEARIRQHMHFVWTEARDKLIRSEPTPAERPSEPPAAGDVG